MTTPKATQARKRDEVNDMPNGSGRMMSEEASVNIGALQQRVYGLESSQRNLADGLSNLAQRVETLFAGLATKIEERSRPQYPLLISIGLLGLAVVSSVGWLAYAPIRENQTDLKLALVELTKIVAAAQDRANDRFTGVSERFAGLGDRYVTIRELDSRSARSRSETDRLNTDLNAQETNLRRSMEQSDANLQRQIDEQKKAFGDTFNLRDAMQQYRRELDDLRQRVTQR